MFTILYLTQLKVTHLACHNIHEMYIKLRVDVPILLQIYFLIWFPINKVVSILLDLKSSLVV